MTNVFLAPPPSYTHTHTHEHTNLILQTNKKVVHAMFPNVSQAAIAHDLEKTRSIELTTDNILSNGNLPQVIHSPHPPKKINKNKNYK